MSFLYAFLLFLYAFIPFLYAFIRFLYGLFPFLYALIPFISFLRFRRLFLLFLVCSISPYIHPLPPIVPFLCPLILCLRSFISFLIVPIPPCVIPFPSSVRSHCPSVCPVPLCVHTTPSFMFSSCWLRCILLCSHPVFPIDWECVMFAFLDEGKYGRMPTGWSSLSGWINDCSWFKCDWDWCSNGMFIILDLKYLIMTFVKEVTALILMKVPFLTDGNLIRLPQFYVGPKTNPSHI